mgnify:CR=1 FL=1
MRPFSLNFIVGPRQVGKTTAVALLIKRLLESGVDPRSIFYFSCDRLADYRGLDEVLRDYLRIRSGIGISTSYVFLDEVTYPREWYGAIKGLIESGVFRSGVLVLTGSLSMSAKREIEVFPGEGVMVRTYSCFRYPFPNTLGYSTSTYQVVTWTSYYLTFRDTSSICPYSMSYLIST